MIREDGVFSAMKSCIEFVGQLRVRGVPLFGPIIDSLVRAARSGHRHSAQVIDRCYRFNLTSQSKKGRIHCQTTEILMSRYLDRL